MNLRKICPPNFLRLLWNRITHEARLKRRGWDYTEKPMLGKPLCKQEFVYVPMPGLKTYERILIFKRPPEKK